MSKKNQQIVPRDGQWAVVDATNSRATPIHNTLQGAVDAAREIARNRGTKLFVHEWNSQIRERNAYGNDSHPPKDKRGI